MSNSRWTTSPSVGVCTRPTESVCPDALQSGCAPLSIRSCQPANLLRIVPGPPCGDGRIPLLHSYADSTDRMPSAMRRRYWRESTRVRPVWSRPLDRFPFPINIAGIDDDVRLLEQFDDRLELFQLFRIREMTEGFRQNRKLRKAARGLLRFAHVIFWRA